MAEKEAPIYLHSVLASALLLLYRLLYYCFTTAMRTHRRSRGGLLLLKKRWQRRLLASLLYSALLCFTLLYSALGVSGGAFAVQGDGSVDY